MDREGKAKGGGAGSARPATGGETIYRQSADFHNNPGCNKNQG